MRTSVRLAAVGAFCLVLTAAGIQSPPPSWLGVSTSVAPGIDLFTASDSSLLDPPAPIVLHLLRLDPSRVRLASALAHDEVTGPELVERIAARHGAIAAVNGGFFSGTNGDPIGALKVSGELVSDTLSFKGAVLISAPPAGRTRLKFDQVSVHLVAVFGTGGQQWTVPIYGVDTTRARGRLMLYTPSYHADSDTAAGGTEWVLDGEPLAVRTVRTNAGRTPIPRRGAVLSFGGLDLPEALRALRPGVHVTFKNVWQTMHDVNPKELEAADSVVSGAGLLRLNGHVPDNWETVEGLSRQNFLDVRYPRTIIGVDRRDAIWLIAVDGRQPQHSVGMTFADLERLCDRLELREALNLDGGGSTTMVVKGRVVNVPSDPAGARPVSDAILVSNRK